MPLIVQKKEGKYTGYFLQMKSIYIFFLNSLGVNLHTARKISLLSTERGFTGQTFKSVGKLSEVFFSFLNQHIANGTE